MSHMHSSAISVKYRIEIPADHREQINWLVRGNPGPGFPVPNPEEEF